MRYLAPLLLLMTGCATTAPSTADRAETWWSHVAVLADDRMEGRLTGSPGYQRAADYVVARLQEYGLEPAGTDGFFQPLALEEQYVDAAASSAVLIGARVTVPLRLGQDMVIGRGGGPRPAQIEAPLVFIGYGLHIPEAGHDDLAGVDLRGKIAVFVGGGPSAISGALKSNARAERSKLLEERGAVGAISLTTPAALESPWTSAMAAASQSGMYFADPELRSVRGEFFEASFNPAESEALFAYSGRNFADIAARSDASQPLPMIDLRQTLRATVVTRRGPVNSANIVARLPGSDPRLAAEHVVLSAHLDGLGIGAPAANGDTIYNGALDNASGVGALLDIAEQFRTRRVRPKRSILFVFVTAEEKGLLGSRYFSRRPSVPRQSIVADLNYDMALPLFPLTGVIVLGADESSLGTVARAVGNEMGLPVVPDPAPNRNSFIRSDQYSFIEQGIPSVAFKFGFAANTPQAEAERVWRATHYHRPSDDLTTTPVAREDEIRLHDFIATMALRIADAPDRPRWNDNSFFRRFARD